MLPDRRCALLLLLPHVLSPLARAQEAPAASILALPTFTESYTVAGKPYVATIVGTKPSVAETTTIPTVVVPVVLRFAQAGGRTVTLNADDAIAGVLQSPIFQKAGFATGITQYGDAVQRAEFYAAGGSRPGWHTLLSQPHVNPPLTMDIPADRGYLLTSKRTGTQLAVVDQDYVERALARHIAGSSLGPQTLVLAVARDVAWYTLGDATVCCSSGTHGVLPTATTKNGQPFILASYMNAGVYPRVEDVEGISEQLIEWINDPYYGKMANVVPSWKTPPDALGCGGHGVGSAYLLAQPTNAATLPNATPVTIGRTTYHVANAVLLPWYMQAGAPGTYEHAWTFPDVRALSAAAEPCSQPAASAAAEPAAPVARTHPLNGHSLIGYWEGYGAGRTTYPLRDVSPQWDVVIVTFASPVKGSTSTLHFAPPAGVSEAQLREDVAYLKSRGRKVLISLGGGGAVVTLHNAAETHGFVQSVTSIVERYGFDGVDLDIETPSLMIQAGDTDFRHPTTPSVVNLIAAMHQLSAHFGPKFMVAEVPEDAQTQAGMQTYAGQFGSFLPVIYGTRDILSFVDAQDYNTPPLEALDGNYYLPGNADYHVAMTEMLLHGFPVGGVRDHMFPAIPASKVAVGLPATPTSARNYTAVPVIEDALRALTEGKTFAGERYVLQQPGGYPDFKGAMFWAINEDARNSYRMSNAIGLLLHEFPAAPSAASR